MFPCQNSQHARHGCSSSSRPCQHARFRRVTIEIQAEEVCFEVAVYNFLRWETEILASRLLYPCVLVQYQGPKLVIPRDLSGRQLFVFESSEGENDVWTDLTLLIRCAAPVLQQRTLANSSQKLPLLE